MIALSSDPRDKTIRAQTAESIALIAELDFPAKWPDLVDQLTGSLSPTSSSTNIAILQTSHSIFSQWRAHVRSDVLFTEINLVLSKFMDPFLALFRHTAGNLLSPPPGLDTSSATGEYAAQAQTMTLLLEIFYDFTCHDLPPALEDAHAEFFEAPGGWFHKFLSWSPPGLAVDADETTPSLPSQVKTGILQIAELYLQLYADKLHGTNTIESFMQGVWTMIAENKMQSLADDGLVSQSLRFLSATIRSTQYAASFTGASLSAIIKSIVVPNVFFRESDEEMFSDDPLEFIRSSLTDATTSTAGLAAGGSDGRTRRQAAADVLKALVSSGIEQETTVEIQNWVQTGLAQYANASAEDRVQGQAWKAKDSAVFLMMAVATRGSTAQASVTSTNSLVDVVQFFSANVFADLEAQEGSVHPILQVDAIRYLLNFRNQLTKEQLLSVLPLLARHLSSQNYVTYTFAAITIDRILSIRRGTGALFGPADVQDFSANLLIALLGKIQSAGTPEKVAENDHLMKCSMRVIITARQTLTPVHEDVLVRLVTILGTISKNPSNPLFDQYIFESISGLMRFVVEGTPATLPTFENNLFGPFTFIIQQDIEQYVPYVFQMLAQMLALHSTVPDQYRSLLPLVFTPAPWQQKGSIPGLVRLLKVFLERDSARMIAEGQIANVLAIVQQRLIPSKLNDVWGFELVQGVVQNVPPQNLSQYFKAVITSLLNRLHSSKTDKFSYLFARLMLYCTAVNIEGLGPDYLISTMEEIQAGLWGQILKNVVVPQLALMPQKDRKLTVVGLTRLLTRSAHMSQGSYVQLWPATYTSLAQLLKSQYLAGATASNKGNVDAASVGMTEIDQEEQTAGYQAAYSRLAASEANEVDPVAYVQNPEEFFGNAADQCGSLVDLGVVIRTLSHQHPCTMLSRRALSRAPAVLTSAGAGAGNARNMATLREIELRLKSVKNIEKITKTMKMIASSQLAKAQRAMTAGKEYGVANSEVFANSTSATPAANTKRLFIVVSSDKGLCGGIHSSVTKATRRAFAGSEESPLVEGESKSPASVDAESPIFIVGDKSKSQISRVMANNLRMTFNQIGRDVPTFADAAGVADLIISSGVEYDSIVIVYNKFTSAISYEPAAMEVRGENALKESDGFKAYEMEDDFTKDLAEFSLANAIYAALVEGHACEVSARRNAMDNASKNAGDMITSLQMKYNRGRQAAITNELVDIITGASAL
ncbi:Importin N-terminal domain-containing protein [Mycena chlorophos]|uniref:ATP synthase subunit gamma, mitochondrial n=1 Tax=Mycena chlorophos TaxID=658473 RepID=A0A8H6T0J4_MYCCL|nr:Importin N-terminal domain-containing protein [Mycena chlorophos]